MEKETQRGSVDTQVDKSVLLACSSYRVHALYTMIAMLKESAAVMFHLHHPAHLVSLI
jgi:hypothetical protein